MMDLISSTRCRSWRAFVALAGLCLVVACSAAQRPSPPARSGPPPQASPSPPSAPARSEPAAAGREASDDVPAAPALCEVMAQHGERSAGASCAMGEGERAAALLAALRLGDTLARDERVAELSGCFSPALILALRADLAEPNCGDAIIAPRVSTVALRTVPALEGLDAAARLSRLTRDPPELTAPFDRAVFDTFLEVKLAPWILSQARAIQRIAERGAELTGYGQGVVAIEAGLADLRFVEVVRAIPLPEAMAQDAELRHEYQNALELELDPRKWRGRDAALVGLRRFAELGILDDPRLDRARELLSKVFAGRRIDSLDALWLPQPAPIERRTAREKLMAQLPPFYAERLLPLGRENAYGEWASLTARGIPRQSLGAREVPEGAPAEVRSHFAAAWARSGQRFWRSADFTRAASVARLTPSLPSAEFYDALAVAMKEGPKDAAHLIIRGPFLPEGVAEVSALDEVAAGDGPWSAHAAFDAALLLAIVPQPSPTAEHWDGIADRFSRAAARAPSPAQEAEAEERATAARETAEAIRYSASQFDP